jgi:phage FluMu protein Com
MMLPTNVTCPFCYKMFKRSRKVTMTIECPYCKRYFFIWNDNITWRDNNGGYLTPFDMERVRNYLRYKKRKRFPNILQ